MVCIYCGSDTQVANSRHQKKANQVWRRRKCTDCSAIFSTIEAADTGTALSVQYKSSLEPFSREKLFVSVYDSLRHRKTAIEDATALTATIIGQLYPFIEDAVLQRETIVEVASVVLDRFDKVAATYYHAYHPTA